MSAVVTTNSNLRDGAFNSAPMPALFDLWLHRLKTSPRIAHTPYEDWCNTLLAESRAVPSVKRAAFSPFLGAVAVAIMLGVVVIFEPSPSDIAIAMVFVAGFFTGNLRWAQGLTLPYSLLGLFLVANLVSLCYAIDVTKGAFYLGVTLFMILTWAFIVGVITRHRERGLDFVMTAFTVGGVTTSFLSALSYFGLLPLGETLLFYDRVKGLFKDPNVFGPYLVLAAIYALHRVLQTRKSTVKLLWLGSCLIASVGVLLSYSRAAWANFAVTTILFFALTSFSGRGALRRNLIYFILATIIIGGAVAYAMTIPQVNEVISYRTELQSYDADRFANFHAALQLGIDNPLGVGPVQSFLMLDYATHNSYLRVFSENGILGFLSFTAFLLVTLLRSVLLSQRAATPIQRSLFALVAAAICGTMLNSFTIDTLHWRHFWLLLALGWMPVWQGVRVTTTTLQRRLS
jgi:O-antigen ligase